MLFAYAKTKAQVSCGLFAQLSSACFCYKESTGAPLSKPESSSIQPSSVAVQPGLCRKPQKQVFSRLTFCIYLLSVFRAQAKDALESYDNAIVTGASVQNGPV